MASLFCGRASSSKNDWGFMLGEDNFSDAPPGERKHLIVIPPRRRLRQSKGLTAKHWRGAFDAEGRLTDVAKLLGKVQRGGVDPSIRPEVWEYLLGAWPIESTAEERRALRNKRRLQFAEVLDQCRAIHPGIGSGKLAYAVNDSRILDARTKTSAVSTGAIGSSLASPAREVEGGPSEGGSSEAPRPSRKSFSGQGRVRVGSREANELGWGAKFLFVVAERNAKSEGEEAESALDVWLEWYADGGELQPGWELEGEEKMGESGLGAIATEVGKVGGLTDRERGVTDQITPEITPELMQGSAPDIIQEIDPERVPEITLKMTPGTTPAITPGLTPQITPETIPGLTTEAALETAELTSGLNTADPQSILNRITAEDVVVGTTREQLFDAEAGTEAGSSNWPENNPPLEKEGQPETEGVAPNPPLKTAVLGRVKTMVAELERRAREEAQEVQASLERRPKGNELKRKERAAEIEPSATPLREGFEEGLEVGGNQKTEGSVLTSAAGGAEDGGLVLTSSSGPSGGGEAGLTSVTSGAGDSAEALMSAEGALETALTSAAAFEGAQVAPTGEVGSGAVVLTSGAQDGPAVLTSATASAKEAEPVSCLADDPGKQEAAVLTSATVSSKKAEGGLGSADDPANQEATVLTSGAADVPDGVLLRGSSLDGFAPKPGLLPRSKSAAAISTSRVSANPEDNPEDDNSVGGYATPGSRFTAFSTPDEAFFTPNRSLSAYSTPKSVAYATPDEGFFTPEQRARSASASPALSKGSARSVKRLVPKPSDWSARKEGGSVNTGSGSKNSEELGKSEAGWSQAESVNTVGSDVGISEREGKYAGDGQQMGNGLEGRDTTPDLEDGVNKRALQPVVLRESRPVWSENPEPAFIEDPPISESLHFSDTPKASGLGGSDGAQPSSTKPPSGVNGFEKRGVNGPAELLLVVENGGQLTALGQGPLHTPAAKPVSLGRVSITHGGLTIRREVPKGGQNLRRKAAPVVKRKQRLLYSGASGEGPEQPAGPVNLTAVETSVADSAEERLTGPAAEKAAEWLWTLHRIVVDVVRTDRNLEFYDVTTNLARMADILAVYAWLDPEVGYCQGMSDLLSPFVVLFQDDADAFWCFARLMRRVRHNFGMRGPVGVLRQLDRLRDVVALTDPTVGKHLRSVDADNFLFAFRILLVKFRRELSFSQVLLLWEMTWAADFGANNRKDDGALFEGGASEGGLAGGVKAHAEEGGWSEDELCVFCVAAILHHNRARLKREVREMDDAVKLFNAMDLRVDVRRCVESAIKRRAAFRRKTRRNAEF